ncbi:MAG: polysaccharide biosynthesis tyrosine autokinase [Chitinophagaceae bacterium]|nr:polysaccharide biosynthesis tyrosine autokinase [Chitinophagaceae bacterium]MBP6478116.1 polysaccharide biosynthesis tyrosine autokinase [Chitinophagaceae bacterium]MBP7108260.1 polysaccharide biosynthesis tyrosine autokinase [Chitinophagaceae bacterium]MBP7314899.1 polysaccharide biosynthesis tyrosine autokinase [Chitinophagaceae bacterium]HQV54649.1 polysaccharide biosynthesis tyrosine autokinase [Chitinophagaceae bacterium]
MEESLNNKNEARSELLNLTIRDVFYKYVRFLPVFILSVALALFGAYAYLRYTTPIYSTGSTMIIKSDQQQSKSNKFDDIFGGGKGVNIQSEMEVLKSRGLMTRVVQKQNLQYNYYVKGNIKTINIYKTGPFIIQHEELTDSLKPFTLKIKFNNEKEFKVNNDNVSVPFGKRFKNQYGTFRLIRNPLSGISKDYVVEYTPTSAAAGRFASAIMVAPKATASAGILKISMEGTNPNQCADVVNQLMDEYGDYSKELKNKTSDQMINFITDRMDTLGIELEIAQNNLLSYIEQNKLIDIEGQTSGYFENISAADKSINEELLKMNTADFIESYLKDKKNVYGAVVVPSSLGLNDATLNELVGGYNALQIKRQELLDGNVPLNNPAVKETNGQIEKLRESLLENLSNIKRSYTKTIEALRKNSGAAQGQLQIIPYKAKRYNELKREVDNKQVLYNVLQEEKEKTAISRASTIENSQIVEKAYVASVPIKPNRRSIQIMALLLGLVVPAVFIFGAELLNDKVTTRFDVEKITDAPILGEIGHSYSEKVMIVNKTTRSMVAEQFRIIRSNLQYVIGKEERFTLLITSSFSGEGKSFLSTNVGAVLALADKKTVILEFDIRKPKVLSGLRMEKGPGLTNFLIGKNDDLGSLIQKVPETENLYVLGCGPIPPNPSELLLSEKVDELFAWLKKEFDVVIVDTAPVGMVSDAQTLSKFCDSTLYMVRQGHTFKKQITLIDEFYTQKKLPKVAVVINDVKLKTGYGYYGYGRYGYGYGYGYGSYYEEETPPPTFFEKVLGYLNPVNWFRKK